LLLARVLIFSEVGGFDDDDDDDFFMKMGKLLYAVAAK
jgi:hypothetical protein